MKQVLKFDENLGDFMPFFCSVCNKMIGNNIIVKVGINYYKSPLCVDCNEARGVRVEGRRRESKRNKVERCFETRLNDALKTLLTTEPEPRIKRIANKVNLTSKKRGRTKK